MNDMNRIVQMPEQKNLFHDARSVGELLAQLAGHSSVCWENPEGAGVFDSDRAKKGVDEAHVRLLELFKEHGGWAL